MLQTAVLVAGRMVQRMREAAHSVSQKGQVKVTWGAHVHGWIELLVKCIGLGELLAVGSER